MSRAPAVIVMAKAPAPGRSKTRLCPPLTHRQAADVAAAALADTLDAVMACEGVRPVLALDGDAGSWVPEGMEVVVQRGDGLDQRLAAAFEEVGGPAIAIAMDTPQVTRAHLEAAWAPVVAAGAAGADVVLGPTTDGGYWVIGLRSGTEDVLIGVPMSRSDTFEHQRRRVVEGGYRLSVIEELVDVDDVGDARVVARSIPASRFGRLVGRLLPDV